MEGERGSRTTCRGGLIIATIGLSLLGVAPSLSAGIIPFDPLKVPSFDPFLKPEDPPLKNIAVAAGNFIIPSLWGQEAIGSDLARADLRNQNRSAVNVVVSDAGVKVGALHTIEVPGTPKKPAMISLRLTKRTGQGKEIDWVNKAIDWWNTHMPSEIPDPRDPTQKEDTNHASHVAGIIGALNPEFGVSPYVEVSDMNIFKGMNLFKPENLAAGLNALLDKNVKVDVMNMSHYLPKDAEVRTPLHKLVSERDAIVVVAAGNEGQYIGRDHSLNMARDVVVVGAMGIAGALSHFSNFGASLDIVAPGEMIVSRGEGMNWKNEHLEVMSGTSMAAPFVTGTFATLRALLPEARSSDLKEIVYKSASDVGAKGKDLLYGHGLLNTLRAVSVARRLIDAGLTSRNAIAQAVTVAENFQFEENARQSLIEARKMGLASEEFERGLRRTSLLRATPQSFKELGAYYGILGNMSRAFAWLYVAANTESNDPKDGELDLVSKLLWTTQLQRAQSFGDRFSLLNNLSNVDLALKTYENIPEVIAPKLTPFFVRKIASLNPDKMKDLGTLIAQKKIEPSGNALVAALSTGH